MRPVYLLIFIFCIGLVSSIDIGSTNIKGIDVSPEAATSGSIPSEASVNSSDYWDDMDTINATQMENSEGVLSILESWIRGIIESYGYGAGGSDTQKTTDGIYLSNDSTTIYFDEAQLNTTIELEGVRLGFNSTYNETYDSYATNVSLNYTQITFDTYNATWDNRGATGGTGTNYYPSDVNLTPTLHQGNLTNGSIIGYAGGDAICNQTYLDSHLCDEFEILQWFQNAVGPDIDDDAWMIAGGPKYIPADVPVNDCNGYTHGIAGTYLGNYFHFNKTTGGDSRALNCATNLKLACCSY